MNVCTYKRNYLCQKDRCPLENWHFAHALERWIISSSNGRGEFEFIFVDGGSENRQEDKLIFCADIARLFQWDQLVKLFLINGTKDLTRAAMSIICDDLEAGERFFKKNT